MQVHFLLQKLSTSSSDYKKIYKTVNYLLNRSIAVPHPNNPNVSELFSSFFVEKVDEIRPSITRASKTLEIEVPSPPKFEHFHCVYDNEIVKPVKTSKRSSSPADPIPVPVLCSIIDHICAPITQAINSSLLSGVVPSAFKAALVRPILKKTGSDPETLSNY